MPEPTVRIAPTPPTPVLNTMQAVTIRTGMSKSRIYQSLSRNELRSFKVGKRRMVTEAALLEFVAFLESVGTQQDTGGQEDAASVEDGGLVDHD